MYNCNYTYRIVDMIDFTNSFESNNLVDVMHEFISSLLNMQMIDYDKLMVVKIKNCGSNKKYPFIVNSYKYNHIDKRIFDNNSQTFIINNKIVLNLFNKLISLNNHKSIIPNLHINNSSMNHKPLTHNLSTNHKQSIDELISNTKNLLLLNNEIKLNNNTNINNNNNNNDDNNNNNNNNNDDNNSDCENNSELSHKIELLKEEIEKMNELKENQLDTIDDAKDMIEQDKDNLANYYCDISTEKRMLRMQKEKAEERLRIFESDKKVYDKIKIDIAREKITENNIPELFVKQYAILKFMDINNLLNTDNEYDTYTSLYDEMYPPPVNKKKPYIPHNIHYDKNKSIPSVDDILADLETDSDDMESDNSSISNE